MAGVGATLPLVLDYVPHRTYFQRTDEHSAATNSPKQLRLLLAVQLVDVDRLARPARISYAGIKHLKNVW